MMWEVKALPGESSPSIQFDRIFVVHTWLGRVI